MSQQHVDAMNALLADSAVVREACAKLPRPATMGYRLTDGPQGQTVHWSIELADTVRFSLEDRPADVLMVGDWAQMIRATKASREDRVADPGVRVEGDGDVLLDVMSVLSTARSVATLPVEIPEV